MISDLQAAWRRRREAPLAVAPDVIGYIGLDTPTELIRAVGLAPVRVIAAPRHDAAEAYAEGLGNPVLRGLAAALLEGPYRGLSKLIVSPTPGAYGWLYTFLRELKTDGGLEGVDIALFDLNHGTATGLDALRRQAVQGLAIQLEAWSGRRAEPQGAIAAANRTRDLQRRIETLRALGELTGAEALAAYGAAEALATGTYQAMLAAVEGAATAGRPVIYSGEETVDTQRYAALEDSGLLVVGDDQDLGSRSIGSNVAETGDPLAAVAHAYTHRSAAPAKADLQSRLSWLRDLISRQDAEAVVFRVTAYDHPAGWETPPLKAALEADGVEVIEADDV
jgi:hypothetical protein